MKDYTKVPEYFNIGVAVTDSHLGTPIENRDALIVEEPGEKPQVCTFKELSILSSKFATILRNLHIGEGFRVLIRLPNSVAYPTTFYGTMKAGAVAVPTSTLLTPKEVGYLASDSGAKVLVIDKKSWPQFSEELSGNSELEFVFLTGEGPLPPFKNGIKIFDLSESLDQSFQIAEPVRTKSSDPAYLVYTSGTTGYPKGVLHAHRALIGRQPASEFWFHFQDHDKILHSGKFNWTYVLGTALMDPMFRGHTVIAFEGKNDVSTWLELIAKYECTIFIGVPTIYRQILQKTNATKADVPSLRYGMCAGEHLTDEVLKEWQTRFKLPIYEGLGMSEFSYYISQNRYSLIRPGSAGKIQPGHKVKLVDSDFHEVPPGEEGMIVVSEEDPGLFLEYWRLPEENKSSRKNGYFLTGDYAKLDEDGYIWFVGRKDDIINTFGYRVSPYEIERVMKSHPAISECVALGEDIGNSKVLVSLCVLLLPDTQVSESELIAFGKERLAEYKAPKKVHFFSEFPRTKNGKVLRKELALKIQPAENNPARG
ncbi:acetyl-CoA synthetase [Leptospira selangorensis]|uniref:acyl-CoA synthetase n=1 Tax=Leptospira selangorensis TaxID=2484982 RepID=UPI001083C467|nr:class I adenylate-forming enzyme family protein [Leptospira selangorensis]TGK03381.1 acetyl-CoA synthetase [Leptospira selangorensis]